MLGYRLLIQYKLSIFQDIEINNPVSDWGVAASFDIIELQLLQFIYSLNRD